MTDNLDELRHIEGFPIGADEDLLALSDPPHYTAYPNPHIAEFIEKWGKPYDEAADDYHREPYVADVSEGKNDPIYNAHSYHTKVPYKAIIPFIEHYTEPGDIVFDGFAGTGMTGIAAQMANRHGILCDLSPAASFISYNFNLSVNSTDFEREAKRILKEVEAECSWLYETQHTGRQKGLINYIMWSDVFQCSYCREELVFWEAAVDSSAGRVQDSFPCPSCGAQVTKRDLTHATERVYDKTLTLEIERNRQVPVLIDYSVGGKRYRKRADDQDLELISKIESSEIPYWYPNYRMVLRDGEWGDQWRSGYHTGVTHIHHFFTRRNLWVLSAIVARVKSVGDHRTRSALLFFVTAAMRYVSRLSKLGTAYYFHGGGGAINAGILGTLYIPSFSAENSVLKTLN